MGTGAAHLPEVRVYSGEWGNLGSTQRGIVQYGISPYRQKAFAETFWVGCAKTWRRVRTTAPPIIVGLLPWYLAMQWAGNTYAKAHRKNPNAPYDRHRGY